MKSWEEENEMQLKNWMTAGLLGLLMACGAGTPDAMGEEKKEKKTFSIVSGEATVAPGAEGSVEFSVVPVKGYKWNKDFPAQLTLKSGNDAVSLKGEQFRGDAFKTKDKQTSVAAGVKGVKAGTSTLSGELRFSVCNEESCIIATEKVEAKVTVK